MNTWPPGRRLPGTVRLRPEFAVRGVAATDAVDLAVQVDANSGAHAGVGQGIYAAVNGAYGAVDIDLPDRASLASGQRPVRQAYDHPVAGLPGLRLSHAAHPHPVAPVPASPRPPGAARA